MDAVETMSKLFELIKLYSRKAELATEMAELRMSGLIRERGQDLSHHKRDRHGEYYDNSFFMEMWQADQDKKEELRNEYSEVCEQIKLLEAMLVDLEPPTLIFHG
jgi:hypothetical protein